MLNLCLILISIFVVSSYGLDMDLENQRIKQITNDFKIEQISQTFNRIINELNKTQLLNLKRFNLSLSSKKCLNPLDSDLEEQLFHFKTLFKNYIPLIELPTIKLIFKQFIEPSFSLNSHNSDLHHGSSECDPAVRNITNAVNEQSVCPWHNVLHTRTHRYPFMLLQAKCNCDTCIGSVTNRNKELRENFRSSCKPVYKLSPALKKTNKCSTGVFEWEPFFEYVSVGCVCNKEYPTISVPNN